MKFKITEHIAVLGNRSKGWKAELNKISWNENMWGHIQFPDILLQTIE